LPLEILSPSGNSSGQIIFRLVGGQKRFVSALPLDRLLIAALAERCLIAACSGGDNITIAELMLGDITAELTARRCNKKIGRIGNMILHFIIIPPSNL